MSLGVEGRHQRSNGGPSRVESSLMKRWVTDIRSEWSGKKVKRLRRTHRGDTVPVVHFFWYHPEPDRRRYELGRERGGSVQIGSDVEGSSESGSGRVYRDC